MRTAILAVFLVLGQQGSLVLQPFDLFDPAAIKKYEGKQVTAAGHRTAITKRDGKTVLRIKITDKFPQIEAVFDDPPEETFGRDLIITGRFVAASQGRGFHQLQHAIIRNRVPVPDKEKSP